mmetsp:Transcript_32673/g.61405  ORF Transcript_32673/g.61405 Transcript_32673/m.61405 type:complete len:240 (+) Transcript_32673:118-837(+)
MSGILDEQLRREDVETALQKLGDDPECHDAFQAVEAATLRSTMCQRRFLQLEGPRLLLNGMTRHLEDLQIQIIGCRVLQHIASLVSQDAGVVLAKAGACEALKASLEQHPSAALHQAACQALELIVFTGGQAREDAMNCGCPEALVASLKRFRSDANVQQACLAALQAILGDSETCQEAIARSGGIAAIVGALADHRDDVQLQYWGQVVLTALCHDNVKLRAEAQQKCHWQRIEIDFDI